MDTQQEGLELKPGIERWSIKTGTDAQATAVNVSPVSGTIVELISLQAPADPDQIPDRLAPTEETVYTLQATLTAYKLEADGDFHLVIADENNNTMIAEIPDPDFCAHSLWLTEIQSARKAFDDRFHQTLIGLQSLMTVAEGGVPMITKVSVPVILTGVGFFDRLHGQTGVAPNGIELHPVLSITFENPS